MKKIVNIIVIVLAVIVVAVFISENSEIITIRFLSWNIKSYTGLLILFSFLSGVLVMGLVWIINALHKNRKMKEVPSQDLWDEEKESKKDDKEQV